MFDYAPVLEDKLEYWSKQPTNSPGHLNSFEGPFKIKDVRNVHEAIRAFLIERFPSATRLSRVNIDEINAALNEVWEGPGSMVNFVKLTWEMKMARYNGANSEEVTRKIFKDSVVHTIDDNLDYNAPEADDVKEKDNG